MPSGALSSPCRNAIISRKHRTYRSDGTAILPARLKRRAPPSGKDTILEKKDIRSCEARKTRRRASPSCPIIRIKQEKYPGNPPTKIGKVFTGVLEDAVFTNVLPKGREAFLRFLCNVQKQAQNRISVLTPDFSFTLHSSMTISLITGITGVCSRSPPREVSLPLQWRPALQIRLPSLQMPHVHPACVHHMEPQNWVPCRIRSMSLAMDNAPRMCFRVVVPLASNSPLMCQSLSVMMSLSENLPESRNLSQFCTEPRPL